MSYRNYQPIKITPKKTYKCPHCKKTQTKVVEFTEMTKKHILDINTMKYSKGETVEGNISYYECPDCPSKRLSMKLIDTLKLY